MYEWIGGSRLAALGRQEPMRKLAGRLRSAVRSQDPTGQGHRSSRIVDTKGRHSIWSTTYGTWREQWLELAVLSD